MTTFHWLLVLGFSPADAAAAVRPDVFVADSRLTALPAQRDERTSETS